jgi:hypothetical protein
MLSLSQQFVNPGLHRITPYLYLTDAPRPIAL